MYVALNALADTVTFDVLCGGANCRRNIHVWTYTYIMVALCAMFIQSIDAVKCRVPKLCTKRNLPALSCCLHASVLVIVVVVVVVVVDVVVIADCGNDACLSFL